MYYSQFNTENALITRVYFCIFVKVRLDDRIIIEVDENQKIALIIIVMVISTSKYDRYYNASFLSIKASNTKAFIYRILDFLTASLSISRLMLRHQDYLPRSYFVILSHQW